MFPAIFPHKAIFLYAYKNNVLADLPDRFPGNNKMGLPPEKTAYFSGSRYDQRCDFSTLWIKLHIDHKSHAGTVFCIDDLLTLQFTDTQNDSVFNSI